MNTLVTGGAGYIGSHAALRLLADGHAVTIVDDLSRGNRAAIENLRELGDLVFVEADLGDRATVARALRERSVECVMHFGALTYVGESVERPLRYYRANVAAAIALLEAVNDAGVDRFIFSSTCATYGEPPSEEIPIRETCRQLPVNPYGRSKLALEGVLLDYAAARRARGHDFALALLRYFNVAGCDPEGRLGEDHDPETHLIPICLDVALGRRSALTIFGDDYATPDGTCIRDYVQVDDLIDAHVQTMLALEPAETRIYNVGLGHPFSVREVLEACRSVTGREIPAVEGARRPGDPPVLYADPAKIRRQLGWTPRFTGIGEIAETAWRWRRENPTGYAS